MCPSLLPLRFPPPPPLVLPEVQSEVQAPEFRAGQQTQEVAKRGAGTGSLELGADPVSSGQLALEVAKRGSRRLGQNEVQAP